MPDPKANPSGETIRKEVAAGLDIHLTELHPMTGGLDAEAQAYRAMDTGGHEYFLKFRRQLAGIDLQHVLRRAGIKEIPTPIAGTPIPANYDDSSPEPPDGFVLLYPFLQAQNAHDRPMQLHHWRRLGETVRKVHDCQYRKHLPQEQFRIANTDRFVAQVQALLKGGAKNEAEEDLVATIKEHESTIERTIRRTAELGDACRAKEWEFVPCHADLHVWNILVGDDDKIYIVDWDNPRLAPPECDLMFIRDGGIAGLHGPNEEQSFFEGYGHQPPNLPLLTYYRYARALDDFVAFAHEAISMPNRSPEQKQEAVNGFKVLFHPNGILESAIRTDR